MQPHAPEPGNPPGTIRARQVFLAAVWFLFVVSALGTLLRLVVVHPVPGVNFAHFLHAHSHTAFLGWIFNAFLALALHLFVPAGERRAYCHLFLVAQVAVLGMLVSYPLQGYGPVSIAFSTLHMACAAVFAWRLWRRNSAGRVARAHLRVALAFLVLSGLGPLALGPLSALGLRESPAYPLAIYFYLHCQYNGWFLFFLQAVLLQDLANTGVTGHETSARRALPWLAVGAVLTLALSVLWLVPPGWVHAVGALGGAAQLVGCALLLPAMWNAAALFNGPARWLAGLALSGFLLKHALQAVSAWPALSPLVNSRFTVIGFLHLVFLVVVTPLLLAWAFRFSWLRVTGPTRTGLRFFFAGVIASQAILAGVPLGAAPGWLPWPHALLAASLVMTAGAVLLIPPIRTQRAPAPA